MSSLKELLIMAAIFGLLLTGGYLGVQLERSEWQQKELDRLEADARFNESQRIQRVAADRRITKSATRAAVRESAELVASDVVMRGILNESEESRGECRVLPAEFVRVFNASATGAGPASPVREAAPDGARDAAANGP